MIRKAGINELENCYTVMQNTYTNAAIKAGYPNRGRANYSFDEFLYDFQKGDLIYYLIYDQDIVGIIRFKIINGNSCKLNDIAVLPEYQGKGYGKELLDFVKNKAKELGAKKVELGMFDDNVSLKEWYEKNGFSTVKTKTYENSPFVIRIFEYVF